MKKLIILFAILLGFTSCVERIDAGCEGIEVSLYGDDRGVGDINLVTGWIFYNPLSTQIYEYPTWVQTIDYPSFDINAKGKSKALNALFFSFRHITRAEVRIIYIFKINILY